MISYLHVCWRSERHIFLQKNWRKRSFTIYFQLKHFFYWNTWSCQFSKCISKTNTCSFNRLKCLSDYLAFIMRLLTHETSSRRYLKARSPLLKCKVFPWGSLHFPGTGFAWRCPMRTNIQRAILKQCSILNFWKAWLQFPVKMYVIVLFIGGLWCLSCSLLIYRVQQTMSGPLKVCSCRNILFFPINHVAFFPYQLHGENPTLKKIKWAQSALSDGYYWKIWQFVHI